VEADYKRHPLQATGRDRKRGPFRLLFANWVRFVILPFDVECEYIKKRLSFYGVKDISKQLVGRVVIASKTLEYGKKIDCGSNHWLKSNKLTLEILRK
jgi:hypothetical protein